MKLLTLPGDRSRWGQRRLLLAPLAAALLLAGPAAWADSEPEGEAKEAPQEAAPPPAPIDRPWAVVDLGMGASIGAEAPGFGIGSGGSWLFGFRIGIPAPVGLQVGMEMRSVVPEARLFLVRGNQLEERLRSGEIALDTTVFARISGRKGKIGYWVQPGFAAQVWEIHQTQSVVSWDTFGGWLGVWLGGHIGGGASIDWERTRLSLSTAISVGGISYDSGVRYGLGPWNTDTQVMLWWRGPVVALALDPPWFPAFSIELSPLEMVAFVNNIPANTQGLSDRYIHMGIRMNFEIPLTYFPPGYNRR